MFSTILSKLIIFYYLKRYDTLYIYQNQTLKTPTGRSIPIVHILFHRYQLDYNLVSYSSFLIKLSPLLCRYPVTIF